MGRPQSESKRIELPPDFDIKKYEAQGVDISLLASSLKKTPTERLEDNKELLKFISEAKKAREKASHGKS